MGAESFTVLAILEARDRASEIFARVDESLDRFGETADRAAGSARGAGAAIDEALGRTVPASYRLDVANSQLAASQARAAEAARVLSDAERELLDAQRAEADGSMSAGAAADRVAAADTKLMAAQRDAAKAAKDLRDAQASQVTALEASAKAGDENAAAQLKVKEASEGSGLSLGKVGKVAGVMALGMGIAAGVMVKAAGNFQDSTTHLVTDAGESQKNLAMVQAGILRVSTATGTSAASITDAMYHIESGGYHGAAGLNLLKIAAEGARVGGADLDTVSKTLVGTMNAYGISSDHAASFMNQLIATVGAGDMRMQDLASSLSSVAPLASKVGLQFSQVGGAIATMTAQGMSAQQATQDLANTIRSLSNPNNVAINEMQQLGINSQDVSKNLGARGLSGTIDMLTQAITTRMGKSGMVLMNAFNQAKFAAQDASTEIRAMPPNLASLAKSFLAGSVTAKAWRTDLQGLPPVQAHLMTQFAATAEKAHSFNSLLAAGGPAAQTYTAALAKMMGGATGLNTALMLTGKSAGYFSNSAAAIAAAGKKAGDNVSNWSVIQGTFNFKLESAKTAAENTGIAIGLALLPAVTSLLSAVTAIVEPIAAWTASHKTLTEILFAGVAAMAATIAVVAGVKKAYTEVKGTIDDVRAGLRMLGGLFRTTAETEAVTAAEGAAAQEEAAGESSASWIVSAARTVAANVAAGAESAAAWLAANAVMTAGIVLVVAAVVAAVVLIVTHWKQVSAEVARIWHDVYSFISKIISDVIGFVKAHWPLLIGIVAGPLGIVAALVVTHWRKVKGWFSDGVHAVESVLSWFGRLPGLFGGWLSEAASAVYSAGSKVLGWFTSLPGKAWNALSVLYQDMLAIGKNVVIGLWNGMVSMGSWLWNQVSSWASGLLHDIGSAFGIGSPSKKTFVHGQMLGYGLGDGLLASLPRILSSVRKVSGAVLSATSGLAAGSHGAGSGYAAGGAGPAVAGGAGGGGGNVIINIDLRGALLASDRDINMLASKVGDVVARKLLPQAGIKFRFS